MTMDQNFLAVILLTLWANAVLTNSEEVLIHGKQESPLSLMVNKTGSYEILVDGITWFQSHDTFFTIDGTTYSSMAGTLKVLQGPDVQKKKHPRLGGMKEISLTWQAADAKKTKIVTSFQLYDENTAIVFTQNFSLSGISGSSVYDANRLCTSFPSFVVANDLRKELGFLNFDQLFMRVQHLGRWDMHAKPISTDLYSSPLTLFNRTKYSVILSSFKEFMVSSMFHFLPDDAIQQGIMGKITEIPKGFVHQSVMQFGSGIKQTIMDWGKMLRTQYNTKRFTDHDMTLKYIGYWTDAGAFYYYYTEPNTTYEKTMLNIKKEAVKEFVPYKYYQIDSWWYFKGPLSNGVKNWTAMPSVFPHNSSFVSHNLGLPLAAHNKFWASETDYAKKNGGAFEFIVELFMAIPQDEEFWNYLLSESKKNWNLILYEQDWLNHQFGDMTCTLENVTVARRWLLDMGKGAMKNNLPIQYCMPMARHLLQSVEIPHVTQARASDDYSPGKEQWNIGLTSIIHHALDLRPFKDNFRTNPIDHNPKYQPEPYPGLQTTVAIYSTGPVGPSDGIGFANVTHINRTINSDGLLLQPSRPMMAVDDYMLGTAFSGEKIGLKGLVWSTYSNVSGFIYGAILAIDNEEPLKITPESVDLEMIGQSYIYMDEAPKIATKLFDEHHPASVGPTPKETRYQLWHTAPTFKFNNQTWAILGETTKYVPMSPNRFTDMKLDSGGIHLYLQMGPEETVYLMVQTDDLIWEIHCEGAVGRGSVQIDIALKGKYVCHSSH